MTTLLVSGEAPTLPAELSGMVVRESTARINHGGQMVVWADLSPDTASPITDIAVWRGPVGAPLDSLETLYFSRMSAPGTSEDLSVGPSPIPRGFNSSGDVSVRLKLEGTRNGFPWLPDAIYRFSDSGPQLLAMEDSQVPAMAEGTIFTRNTFSTPRLDSSGRIGFYGRITGPGVDASNDAAAWLASGSSVAPIVREGAQADGLPSGVLYGNSLFPTPVGSGEVVVSASLTGAGVDSTNNRAYFIGNPGAVAPFFRLGDPTPGLPGQAWTRFRSTKFSDDGRALLRSEFGAGGVSAGEGLWSGHAGDLELVAATGTPAAGMTEGETYASIADWPSMAPSGPLGFVGTVTGPTVDDSNEQALWIGNAGALSLIAREGDEAPLLESGVVFDRFVSQLGLVRNLALNSSGVYAFWSGLRGTGVDDTNDEAVWIGRLGGSMQPLLRAGDLFEIAPGDERVIDAILPRGSGQYPNDGEWITFTESGDLLVELQFTDGSVAQVLATIPTLPTPVALAPAGLLALRRRRDGNAAPRR